MGSCITYNFINKYHEFVGGAISPGMEMRLKSLNYYTAKLPLVKADSNVPLIGYDTTPIFSVALCWEWQKKLMVSLRHTRKSSGTLTCF